MSLGLSKTIVGMRKKYQRLGTKTKSDAGLWVDERKTYIINECSSHPGEMNRMHLMYSGVCVCESQNLEGSLQLEF